MWVVIIHLSIKFVAYAHDISKKKDHKMTHMQTPKQKYFVKP